VVEVAFSLKKEGTNNLRKLGRQKSTSLFAFPIILTYSFIISLKAGGKMD